MEDHVTLDSVRRHFSASEVRREEKQWGEEHWIVNREYAGKKLLIQKDRRSSLHRHESKDEVFYLESGSVLLEVGAESFTLAPGDFAHVPAGTQHRFTGLASSVMIEFSTFHDEGDSFRSEPSGHLEPDRVERQLSLIERFPSLSVLVVGDVMVDTYVSGSVERISREAPVPVLRFASRVDSPGGAANVARNVSALGARVALFGVRGDDDAGSALDALLEREGVENHVRTDASRCTTKKTRITGLNRQQLLRIDEETTDPISSSIERHLLEAIGGHLGSHQVVVLSDYAKGVIRPGLLRGCIDAASEHGIPVVLAPKPQGPEYLEAARGVRVLLPNREEAERLSGLDERASVEELAEELGHRVGATVMVTLGAEGIVLNDHGDRSEVFPATPTEVADVSGAGDTVVAAVALAMAAEADSRDAAHLANRAAGLVVAKRGTSTVAQDELRLAL